MQLIEPQRGQNILQSLNWRASWSHWLFSFISFLADAPIFLLPIFLIIVYIIWIKKNNIKYKQLALYTLFAVIIAFIINIILQKFFIKVRPETVLQSSHNLLLNHLPTMSFPSDHAAVSMAFAFAVLFFTGLFLPASKIQGIFYKLALIFIIASIIMSIARVAVGVHWPTDILAGWIIGIVAAYIARYFPKRLINFLIKIEQKITN